MPGDTEQSATANLSLFFSLSKIHQQKVGTMAPENEETEPRAADPTQTDAPVAPADPAPGQEVVQDQVTETHVEERPTSDDEDAKSEEE